MNCETYNHSESCLKTAVNLFHGEKPDPGSAYHIFERNCLENGHERSCYASGIIRATGLASHQPDFPGALVFFEKSCQSKFPAACFQAGLLHLQDSPELPRNLEKAAKFLEQACDLGHSRACYNLGIMHKNGDHYPQNEQKYLELLEKAEKNRQDFGPLI